MEQRLFHSSYSKHRLIMIKDLYVLFSVMVMYCEIANMQLKQTNIYKINKFK